MPARKVGSGQAVGHFEIGFSRPLAVATFPDTLTPARYDRFRRREKTVFATYLYLTRTSQ